MNEHPLLPFAYTSSTANEPPLRTTQADELHIHSRQSSLNNISYNKTPSPQQPAKVESPSMSASGNPVARKRPVLKFVPSLKRKMDSFNEKNDVKRRDMDFATSSLLYNNSTIVDSENNPIEDVSSDLLDDLCSSGMDMDAREPTRNLPPSSPPLTADDFIGEDAVYEGSFDADNTLLASPSFKKPVYRNVTSASGRFQAYSPHKQGSTQSSSDADFGIDHFNRFKNPSVNVLPSSNPGFAFEDAQIQSQNTAKQIISEAFEDMITNINLENMDLYEVPDEIKDMNNLVIFHNELEPPVSYQLYLTGNNIRDLMPSLFEFTKLNVLGLRQNKMVKIPPLISKLVNLTDLTLGTNRLEYLPFQILDLHNLRTFRAGPNPYVTADPNECILINAPFDPRKQLKYISRVKYLVPESKAQLVPTMKNLCLSKIAGYDVSYQETQAWKQCTPKLYHNLIIEAITKGRFGDVCSECEHIVVQPVAEVIEWWDYLNNKEIPIRRQFCSGMCVKQYERRIEDTYFGMVTDNE